MHDSKLLTAASILYHDDSLLILHKPTGLPSVPHTREEISKTAIGFALAHARLTGIGPNPLEPGLLHRLDTGTSGILVFAKTADRFDQLKNLWKSEKVRKWYRAITANSLTPLRTTITRPLGHSAKSSKKMVTLPSQEKTRGKPLPAITLIEEQVILANGLLDLTIEIKTGVRHQIRAHLAALGSPILGDPIYKGAAADRLYLHAWKIEIPLHPNDTAGRLLIEARLPESWPY